MCTAILYPTKANEVNFMKKMKIMAAITAAMCCFSGAIAPVMTVNAETTVPVTNEELETLLDTMNTLGTYLCEKGYIENSASTSLLWDNHFVDCYVKSESVGDDVMQFASDNGLSDKVNIIVAPEYNYEVIIGGQRSYDEVNTIVADEYLSLKKHLKDANILSNIYLTTKYSEPHPDIPYSCVDIYVKTQEDADELKKYMLDNYYWDAVVDVTVQPELSAITEISARYKSFICTKGDSNDDGEFGIADVIKLKKYLLNTEEMTERQGAASDINSDGTIDVFDLCAAKSELINK